MGIFSLFVENKPEITIFGQLLDLLHARHEHSQNNQYIVASTGGVVRRETGGPDCSPHEFQAAGLQDQSQRPGEALKSTLSGTPCSGQRALCEGDAGTGHGVSQYPAPSLGAWAGCRAWDRFRGRRPRADQQTPNQSRRASTENDSRAHRCLFSSGPRSHHALATEVEPDNEVRHRPGRVCRPVASQQTGTGRTSSG